MTTLTLLLPILMIRGASLTWPCLWLGLAVVVASLNYTRVFFRKRKKAHIGFSDSIVATVCHHLKQSVPVQQQQQPRPTDMIACRSRMRLFPNAPKASTGVPHWTKHDWRSMQSRTASEVTTLLLLRGIDYECGAEEELLTDSDGRSGATWQWSS